MTGRKQRASRRPGWGIAAVALVICLGLANYLLDRGPIHVPPNMLPVEAGRAGCEADLAGAHPAQ